MAEKRALSLAELCPNMPEIQRSKLATSSTWDWHPVGDINQGDIFDRKYREVAGYYYAEATGRDPLAVSILKLFEKYRPVVEAVAKEFTYSTEKVNGEFMGDLARGASETTIRPLVLDSFGSAANVLSAVYSQNLPGAPAELHIIPDRVSHAAGRTVVVTHDKRRTWIILGYAELVATVSIIDAVQEHVNDRVGFRKPIYVYPQHAMTNLLLVQKGTPLWVETNHEFDLDGYAINNTMTGMWPIGVEVIVDVEIGLNLGWPTAAEH